MQGIYQMIRHIPYLMLIMSLVFCFKKGMDWAIKDKEPLKKNINTVYEYGAFLDKAKGELRLLQI
jgi:hypothetical protein